MASYISQVIFGATRGSAIGLTNFVQRSCQLLWRFILREQRLTNTKLFNARCDEFSFFGEYIQKLVQPDQAKFRSPAQLLSNINFCVEYIHHLSLIWRYNFDFCLPTVSICGLQARPLEKFILKWSHIASSSRLACSTTQKIPELLWKSRFDNKWDSICSKLWTTVDFLI